MTTTNTTPKNLSRTELADRITLNVHPSNYELGPIASGMTDRKGVKEWHESKYTRLELPATANGSGLLWIDYDDHAEAVDALERARKVAIEGGFEALSRFYVAE